MSVAEPGALPAAHPIRRPARLADRALIWLPALAATVAVAAYLSVHRDLVVTPGRDLWAALASGPWAPGVGVLASFALLWLPPAVALAALAAAIWPWTRFYERRPTPRLLAAFILTSAAVVGIQIGLAALGALATAPLAVVTLGVAALLLVARGPSRRPRRFRSPPPRRTRRLAGDGLAARAAARLDLAPPTPLGLALAGLTAVAMLGLLALAALVPPWGWDALVYHLTDVFQFARSGRLEPFAHPAHQFHFPKVGELHSLWFYLLAGAGEGAWRVTGVAQLPLALTAGVAVRTAAETLGLRAALPWLAPAMMLTPLVLVQTTAGYVDLAFAAFLLAAFAFLLAAVRRHRTADWCFAALAAGLATGTKLSFAYLCLPLLLLLTVPPLRELIGRRALLRWPLCLLLFAVGCGFWLVPGLARSANPFYPVAVTVGGRTLLDGPVVLDVDDSHRGRFTDSLAGWAAYPFGERHLGELGYTPDSGFGPQFAAAYVALPFALLLAWRRRQRLLARALLAAPAVVFAWLAFSPWEHPRYALAACGLALLGLAAVEEATLSGPGAGPAPRWLLRAALVPALLFGSVAGLFAAAPELPRAVGGWRAGDWSPEDLYPLHFGPSGSAFNWLSERGGPDTTVTFDRHVFVAPLFGWHGLNRVVYAPSLGDRRMDGQPLAASYATWRRFLEREKVDWVVLWQLPDARPSRQARWVEAHPEGFLELASFGPRARVLAPREGAPGPNAGPSESLAELTDPAGWVLEYATGAEAEVAADPVGGLRVDYRFLTARPDYLDLRFDLSEGDWPATDRLGFSVESAGGSPLLFVYLKEADERRNCRFRIPPLPPAAEPRVVELDLARPEASTPGFDVGRVAAVHLVLDDAGATRPATGSFRLDGFRLRPSPESKEGS